MNKRVVATTVRCLAAIGVILSLMLAGAAPSNHGDALPSPFELIAQ